MICLMLMGFLLTVVPLHAGGKFLIDIDKGTIGSVGMKDSLQQLKKNFGSKNVTTATENLEGESSVITIISIDGH
ncbi:MAG: hypothetical protein MUP30_10530, partial [Deltaproteobacteria bacterium]|nr:hypothetical protein [Deltaproteobacteria bacterium]